MKKIIATVSVLLCAILMLSSCSSRDDGMGERMAVPSNLSAQENIKRTPIEGDIYVSPDGDDSNYGKKDAPVKTPQRAVELAKDLKSETKTISFFPGEYRIDSINFDESTNGITLAAHDGEVIFNGGVTLNASDFKKHDDNIYVVDLKEYGVTEEQIGRLNAFGQYNTAEKYNESGSLYCELFFGGERMTLARYPNAGEADLRTGKIIDNGDSKEIYTSKGTETLPEWETIVDPRGGTFGISKELSSRMKGWKSSPDIWMFGYFQYDWADSTTPLKSFEDDSITTKYASVYGFKEDMPFYFFNVLEELDAKNEWYIDKENLLLYFYPPDDFGENAIEISLSGSNLINLDQAQNVTFDGITFTGTRANAIQGTGNNVTVKNCTVKNVGESAIEITGEKITVDSNIITATGKAGVILTGGDRNTLTSSENIVTNNLIYDWSQVYQTYQPAVNLIGVGGVCSHNEIFNSPHEAIAYKGNNHIIEYNNIHDVVLKSSDAGAIYSGRSWSECGNIIRYNAIYNIGSDDFAPSGIYFDDALSGQSAYGNVLVNIPGNAFLIGGGRNVDVSNNLIINSGSAIYYDERAIDGIEKDGWFRHANEKGKGLWATLDEVDINSPQWKEAYPYLTQWTDDFNDKKAKSFAPNPSDSKVERNIILDKDKSLGYTAKRAEKYSSITDNYIYALDEDLFNDGKNGDYSLKSVPDGFTDIPYEKIGRTSEMQ